MKKYTSSQKNNVKTQSPAFLLWLLFSGIVVSAQVENPEITVHATATPGIICQGSQTQLNVEVSGGVAPFVYHWSSNPPGFSSGIADPVASPMIPTWFIVDVTDGLFQTGQDSAFVDIADPPPPPGSITGPGEVCNYSHATYSISPVPGAWSYSWSVPEGDTIENGQNTTTIDVLWYSAEGPVSVIAGNDCGNSVQSVLAVLLLDTVTDPGPIVSPDTACKLREIDFSITPVTGSTSYFWTVPPDASIVEGEHGPTIEVLWGTMSGQVSVVAHNICGDSHHTSVKTIITDSMPEPPAEIAGKDTACMGESGYSYSFPPVGNAKHYIWSLPAGVSFVGNTDTNSVILRFSSSAVSGNITVFGQNDCGDGNLTIKPVLVRDCTGIAGKNSGFGFSVFPNPASDRINISGHGTGSRLSIRISDIRGKPVLSTEKAGITGDFQIQQDVTGWARGIYFVRLTCDQFTCDKKIIIQ
ncbi:MAG: T9SS type A sorting domain-containing protein [Bacteroidetes bacterium]|nr:T9SS type A sorting domain-containing protein [Bacteroidota bacterium]